MKYFLIALTFGLCLILSGCEDTYEIPNPAMKKGYIISKDFIPAKNFHVAEILRIGQVSHNVCAATPEIYLITIGTSEPGKRGNTIHSRNHYIVTPSLFGELRVGQEIDFADNSDAKLATIN